MSDLDSYQKLVNETVSKLPVLITTNVLTTRHDDFWKVALPRNKKAPPPTGWSDPKAQSKNTPKHIYGILTGKRNKLIVLDVDSKDDGVKELQKYLREYGALNTYTVSTPSGGFHYYFNYDPQNYLMATYLTNRTKYRNCGLDIRTNGG